MGLYLCVLNEDEDEIDGVEVGSYDDFGRFRDAVGALDVDGGFPTLLLHPDNDGEWTPDECTRLLDELATIRARFEALPPAPPAPGTWQAEVAKTFGVRPTSLYESFFDVDGENLIDRLAGLANAAIAAGRPILFQ